MDLYKDQLKKPHTSVVECHFEEYFDQQVRELENSAGGGPAREQREFASPNEINTSLSSGIGSDEPPPIPGLLKGLPVLYMILDLVSNSFILYSPAKIIIQRHHLDRRNARTDSRNLSSSHASHKPHTLRKGRAWRARLTSSQKISSHIYHCIFRRRDVWDKDESWKVCVEEDEEMGCRRPS